MWKELPKPRGKQPLLGHLKKAEPKPSHPTNVAADDDEVSIQFEGTQCGRYLTTQDRAWLMMRVTVTRDTVKRSDVSRFQRRYDINALG